MEADSMEHSTAQQGDADHANGDRIDADVAPSVDSDDVPEEAASSAPSTSRSDTGSSRPFTLIRLFKFQLRLVGKGHRWIDSAC